MKNKKRYNIYSIGYVFQLGIPYIIIANVENAVNIKLSQKEIYLLFTNDEELQSKIITYKQNPEIGLDDNHINRLALQSAFLMLRDVLVKRSGHGDAPFPMNINNVMGNDDAPFPMNINNVMGNDDAPFPMNINKMRGRDDASFPMAKDNKIGYELSSLIDFKALSDNWELHFNTFLKSGCKTFREDIKKVSALTEITISK